MSDFPDTQDSDAAEFVAELETKPERSAARAKPAPKRRTYDDIDPKGKAPNVGARQERVTQRTRIPMSMPQLKLEVPEIPGYHLHWFLNTPGRISRALAAGYTFVEDDEVDIVNTGLANDRSASGNTDLGTRVSISAGSAPGDDGQEQRLYLMKIPEEWWEEDQAELNGRNEQIAATLRGGGDVEGNPHGADNRYIPEAHRRTMASLFTPKRR